MKKPPSRKWQRVYPIRLPESVIRLLEKLARKKRVPPTALARRYIAVGLSEELGKTSKDLQQAKRLPE